jgi:hypothetical protein
MSDLDKLNYFEIFSLPVSPHQDLEVVESIYNKLLIDFHPDKFNDGNKKIIASNIIDKLHIGYKTLTCTLKIRLYLLELHSNNLDLDSCDLENHFLEQVFELSELIENDPLENLTDLSLNLEEQYKNYIRSFDMSFQEYLLDNNVGLKQSIKNILKAKYIDKLMSSCKERS